EHGALAGGGEILLRLLAEQRLNGVRRRPFLVARLVELLDVCEEQVARRGGFFSFPPQNFFWENRPLPLRRYERNVVEDLVAAEVSLEPLIDDDVRRDDQKVGRERRTGHPLLVEARPD